MATTGEKQLNPTFEPYRYEEAIKEAYLIGSKKEVIDITENLMSCSIFEDLFANTVSGNAILRDKDSHIKSQNLNGADKLILVTGAANNQKNVLEFLVYSHSYVKATDTSEMVTLNFIALPFVISQNIRLWGGYKGSIAAIANNVFNGVIEGYNPSSVRGYKAKSPTIECDATEGIIKLVSPGWSPFQLLSWLSGRATNPETSGSLFLFYQTIFDGYKFKCVEKLISDGNTKELADDYIFYYGYTGAGYDKNNVKSLTIGKLGDTLKGSNSQYTNLWHTDITKKKITKRTYTSDVASTPLLNAKIMGQLDNNNGFDYDFSALRKTANLKSIIKNESSLIHDNIDFYTANSFQRKFNMLKQIQTMNISIETFSNSKIKVGDVVEMIVPQRRGIDKKDNLKRLLDNELSGRYIVGAKSLHYTMDEVKMQMQLIKDSVLE